jgi:hypothetical protein
MVRMDYIGFCIWLSSSRIGDERACSIGRPHEKKYLDQKKKRTEFTIYI